MMLIILDKDPIKAARKVPASIRHKQLLELMQMLSCIVEFGYDRLPQGKDIKIWISNNKNWVWWYVRALYEDYIVYSKPKLETKIKYRCLTDLLECASRNEEYIEPTTAILRYKKGYECKYPTNTELPIDECIREYEKYLAWKGWK